MSGWWEKMNGSASRSVFFIAGCSLLSRILGLVRDRALAHNFGTGPVLEAYVAAFRIPDFIFSTLILGAFGAAFIPVFIKAGQDGQDSANRLSSNVLRFLLAVAGLAALLIAVFASWLVPIIIPGFNPETTKLTIQLTRVMLLAIPLFTLSNVFSGILNGLHRYLTYSLAPIFYNLGILAGIVIFYGWWGPLGLAVGVAVGAALHALVQFYEVRITGWRYVSVKEWLLAGSREVLKKMGPRMLGLAVSQVNQLVVTAIASTLAVGSVSVLYFANNLQNLPIGLIAVSFSIVAFPLLASAHAQGEKALFLNHFSLNFRRIIFWIVPAAMLLLVLRAQVVRVLLGSGAFSWTDTYLTAQVLGIFTLSLLPQALQPLIARTFYAQGDTRTPTWLSGIILVATIPAAIMLGQKYGVLGLAGAFTLAALFNFAALLVALHQRLGGLDDVNLLQSLARVSGISLMAAAASYGTLQIAAPLVNMRTAVGILTQGASAGLTGLAVYFGVNWLLRTPEMTVAREWWAKKRSKEV